MQAVAADDAAQSGAAVRLDAAKWRAWDAMMVRSIRALEAAKWSATPTLMGWDHVHVELAGAIPTAVIESEVTPCP